MALMLLIGALLGLNLRRLTYSADCLKWIAADRLPAQFVRGWPLVWFRAGVPESTVLPDILLVDVLCWILLILLCAWVCERYSRNFG